MEKKVPWWRRALQFALSGFRSGFGLLARIGKDVAGAVAGAESELATKELENPEEDTELKHSSPHSEEIAAEVEQAAEIAANAEARPAAEAAAAEAVPAAEEPAEAVVAEVGAATAEIPADVEAQRAEVKGGEVVQAETGAGEQAVDVAAVEEPAAAVEEQVSPSAQVAETERVTAADPAPIQEMAAREIPLALPFVPEPAQEKTTAEKVAAALKARGQDAEQSPFSVIVSQVYDGPLDLLLDLIRKQDIDIYDIPIAKITAQFLAYVDQLKASDMDVAGEFIYTAALLIHIKSKMLLPRAPAGPEDAAEDPRRELVERLLEHERFKNAAQMLKEKQMVEAATWTNPGAREFREDEGAESETAPEIAADTVDLVRVFRDILERARNRPVINVEEDTVTVGQMIQFLARRLTMEDKPVALRRLLSHTRSERALIAMFLALLELVRLQAILLRQDRHFSEIFIKKHAGFDAVMNQGLANARDDWR
jgi:segregation and condensation protein A